MCWARKTSNVIRVIKIANKPGKNEEDLGCIRVCLQPPECGLGV